MVPAPFFDFFKLSSMTYHIYFSPSLNRMLFIGVGATLSGQVNAPDDVLLSLDVSKAVVDEIILKAKVKCTRIDGD